MAKRIRIGLKVKGNASPGDKVSYGDMANPRNTIWEVIDALPAGGYMLISPDGRVEFSDLRQHGWEFES